MQDLDSCKENDVTNKKRCLVSELRKFWKNDESFVGEFITDKMIGKDIIISSLARVVDLIALKNIDNQGTASFYMNREAESKCGSIYVRRSLYVLSCNDLLDILSKIKNEH